MANEIRVHNLLQINKGNLVYQTSSPAFVDDMEGEPQDGTPGHMVATVDGNEVDLSGVTNPKWCEFKNFDDTNSVALGVYNTDQSEFYPIFLVGPGEHFNGPLHHLINQEFAGTGTGTTGQANKLWVQAENAACNISVKAFPR